ncbi:DNA-binding transcriptional regulator YhcF (GntR family) [Natranaerovirga hydrolytica]|uniref:DNA-binding transcriptional regulator YhcF (GntR family) n=1 Tax=Natranaerovirga hydrolytica TaxID=680378 RepID=A0A4R1MZ53_9FIRM|nr:GntR family transcriptional regulator [Natranaerovirga hydrolytica]TCK98608.1 DNA-binding transcriptional regulator YhcF (GntR family) [Natranaerovirga hydrolytica]
MELNFNSDKPIYLQLAEYIEDNILNSVFEEASQIPSTTEMSVTLKINPATAAKGVNLLVDESIIYKKRGVGMFVMEGAKEKILNKRKESFYEGFICALVAEAQKLNITQYEIIKMIERGYEDGCN